MIAKILSMRGGCRATVRYAFGQTDSKKEYQADEAYFLTSNQLTIPDPTITVQNGGIVQVPAQLADLSLVYEDLEEQASRNNRAEKPFWHAVLSIAPEDEHHLGDIQMRELAHDFMKRMGYESCRWVATVHRDTAHSHIHLAACTVREEPGHPVVDRYQEYRRAIESCRKLELAYSLQQTPMPAEGKAPNDPRDNPRLDEVRGILDWALLQELEEADEPTLPGYLARAQACGVDVQVRWRQGEPAGVSFGFKGATFSATQLRAGGRYQLKALQHHLHYCHELKEELEAVHAAEPDEVDVLQQSRGAVHERLRQLKADTDDRVFISLSFESEVEARAFAAHPETPVPTHLMRQEEMVVLFFQTDHTHEELEDPDVMKLVEKLMMELLELCRKILALIFGLGVEGASPGIHRHPAALRESEPVVAEELDL